MALLHPNSARLVFSLAILGLADIIGSRFGVYWPLASVMAALLLVLVFAKLPARDGAALSGEAIGKFFGGQRVRLLATFVAFWVVRLVIAAVIGYRAHAALEEAANAPQGPAFVSALLAYLDASTWTLEKLALLMLLPYALAGALLWWWVIKPEEKSAHAALARHGIRP